MFPRLMQSSVTRKISGRLPVIAIGPMSAQTTVEFPESIRINGLRNIITQSGLARISGTSSNSSLNEFISFAKSQRGRSGANLPDFVLTQQIFESREYQPRVINKTYRYILELVDLNPNSSSLGQVVVSERKTLSKWLENKPLRLIKLTHNLCYENFNFYIIFLINVFSRFVRTILLVRG